MAMTICVPLKYGSFDEVIKAADHAAIAGADIVEIWLDTLPFGKKIDKQMAKMCGKIELPILCVNKAAAEQGNFEGSEEGRITLLEHAIHAGVDYIDIGIHTDPQLIAKLKETIKECGGMTQLIISYHNFETTPEFTELKEIVRKAQELGADMVKVATYANDDTDNETIFELLDFIGQQSIKGIGVCMSEKGRRSRVEGCAHGSLWTYGALNDSCKTAPGQLTINELQDASKA